MGLLGIFSNLLSNKNNKHVKKQNYYTPQRIETNHPLSLNKYVIKFNRDYKKPLKFEIQALSHRHAYDTLMYKYYIKRNPLKYKYEDAIIRQKST